MHCPSAIRAANEILEVVLTLLDLEGLEHAMHFHVRYSLQIFFEFHRQNTHIISKQTDLVL